MKTLAQKVCHRILSNLDQIPFVQPPVELDYLMSLQQYASHLPVLATEDQALVQTIRDEGVYITS